jgi:hypothetical protein
MAKTKRAVCCAWLCVALGAGTTAHAAEYDPYWGWRAPPRDAAVQINRSLNALLVRGLADVNARNPTTCREAARILTAPLVVTSEHFFRSEMRHWTMDRSPRNDRERALFDDVSIYRDTPLFPFGHFVPLDPTLQAGDVLFGPDKIGHFFTNGLRSWHSMLDRRAAGATDEEAFLEAMRYGVVEEKGWLGFGIDGVFSFADLHAMSAGVRFYSALCDEAAPTLQRGDDGRWSLSSLFRIEDHVDPCWDESFAPSAFTEREGDNVARALTDVCPLLGDDVVRARRARYAARGCHAGTKAALDRLVAAGDAPDPSRWDIAGVCATSASGAPMARGVTEDVTGGWARATADR